MLSSSLNRKSPRAANLCAHSSASKGTGARAPTAAPAELFGRRFRSRCSGCCCCIPCYCSRCAAAASVLNAAAATAAAAAAGAAAVSGAALRLLLDSLSLGRGRDEEFDIRGRPIRGTLVLLLLLLLLFSLQLLQHLLHQLMLGCPLTRGVKVQQLAAAAALKEVRARRQALPWG